MPADSLPHGLRHVLVHVSLGTDFPPPKDSPRDIALLRAANLAMQRKTRGIGDAFLFVTVGLHDHDQVTEALATYGFPKASVVCIEADDVESRLEFGEETLPAEVGTAIETWLNLEHMGAVARVCVDYPASEFWWSGVEHDDEVFAWPFEAGTYGACLPTSHKSRAGTWLSIVGHAIELHAIQATTPDNLGLERAAAWALTLCEWLHGFEEACGNGYNNFEEELDGRIMPSEFFLGFELARLSGDDLESLCDAYGADVDGLHTAALKAITNDLRNELRHGLANFFGGDGGLYWTLHSAIWPEYTKPMPAAMNDLLNPVGFEELGERDSAWRFVSEGWCEEADD